MTTTTLLSHIQYLTSTFFRKQPSRTRASNQASRSCACLSATCTSPTSITTSGRSGSLSPPAFLMHDGELALRRERYVERLTREVLLEPGRIH
jgi:hypothetical protein